MRSHVFPAIDAKSGLIPAAGDARRPCFLTEKFMTDYKISRFTLAEPLPNDSVGLFNTLTGALGLAPMDVWRAVAGGSYAEPLDGFLRQGFVVEHDADEELILRHWRLSQAYDLSRMAYLVSPTRACNMSCNYCIHGRNKRPEHMNRETARRTLDFIVSDIDAKAPRSVHLDFGGAEALLNPEVVVYLAEGAWRYCLGRGTEFAVGLMTNGLALSVDFVKTLKRYGLRRVRVTLSGPADIHNQYRPARDHHPTYDRILANIRQAADHVEIAVTGQYNPIGEEFLRFPEVVDDLAKSGLREAVADVAFGPFVPQEEDNGGLALDAAPLGCLQDEDPSRFLWLQEQIGLRGFKTLDGPPANRCLANYRNAMVIDVDGRFGVCPSMMDHPELDYGDVAAGVDFRKEARLLVRDLPGECVRNCPLAPLCDGGCRLQAMTRTGSFDGVNCLHGSYEYLIRSHIRKRVGGIRAAA